MNSVVSGATLKKIIILGILILSIIYIFKTPTISTAPQEETARTTGSVNVDREAFNIEEEEPIPPKYGWVIKGALSSKARVGHWKSETEIKEQGIKVKHPEWEYGFQTKKNGFVVDFRLDTVSPLHFTYVDELPEWQSLPFYPQNIRLGNGLEFILYESVILNRSTDEYEYDPDQGFSTVFLTLPLWAENNYLSITGGYQSILAIPDVVDLLQPQGYTVETFFNETLAVSFEYNGNSSREKLFEEVFISDEGFFVSRSGDSPYHHIKMFASRAGAPGCECDAGIRNLGISVPEVSDEYIKVAANEHGVRYGIITGVGLQDDSNMGEEIYAGEVLYAFETSNPEYPTINILAPSSYSVLLSEIAETMRNI